MQSLGKVMIIPKGAYDATATYEILDMVNHENTSWLCKKDCKGQTPSNDNAEYWMMVGASIDVNQFVPITGGVKVSRASRSILAFENTALEKSTVYFWGAGKKLGELGASSDGPIFFDADGNEYVLAKMTDVNQCLPIDGSKAVRGDFYIGTASDTTKRCMHVRNVKRDMYTEVDANGIYHLYDGTNKKNILTSSADGATNIFYGSAKEDSDAISVINQNLGGLKFVKLTQAQYDALSTKDANTIYFTTD